MRDEKDLDRKYIVIKIEDIKRYMPSDRQQMFWSLFWEMVDSRERTREKGGK